MTEMKCLHCGDCCRRMSPFSAPDDPCPYMIEAQGLVFCSIYENRPQQCRDRGFRMSKCPIGVGVLGLKTQPQVQNVLRKGQEIIISMKMTDEIDCRCKELKGC